jgi:hypothetical protein
MPIMQTRSRAQRRDGSTVPAKSFHCSLPVVLLSNQIGQPIATIRNNELSLVAYLFKKKKAPVRS